MKKLFSVMLFVLFYSSILAQVSAPENVIGLPEDRLVPINGYIEIPLWGYVESPGVNAIEIKIKYNPYQIDILDGYKPWWDYSLSKADDGFDYESDSVYLYKVSAISAEDFYGYYDLWVMECKILDTQDPINLTITATLQDTINPSLVINGLLKPMHVDLWGDVNKNSSLTLTDAAAILKACVGYISFDDTTSVIANVSGSADGYSSYDAYLVMQKTLGNLWRFPVEGGDDFGSSASSIKLSSVVSLNKMELTAKTSMTNGDLSFAVPKGVKVKIGPALADKFYEMWTDKTGKLRISFFGKDTIFSNSGSLVIFEGLDVEKIKVTGKANHNAPLEVVNDAVTSLEEATIPDEYLLNQNYPNPFNPSTTISYQLPEASQVTIKVYDVLGNEVASIVNEEKPAGSYDIKFDASGLASGIYFYKIQAGNFVQVKKMTLAK